MFGLQKQLFIPDKDVNLFLKFSERKAFEVSRLIHPKLSLLVIHFFEII
jgi:hypothetical protein